jgi:hypothetical protein
MTQITNTSLRSILTLAFVCTFPLLTQAQSPYRSRNIHLGVSGSNVQDFTNAGCCSGTLGSLVTNGTSNYILSNNHVLARRDKAGPGEDISQPGLIDNGCRAATIVADFTAAPRLGSNVDAAIAQVRNGLMDTSGFIEGIGTISSVVAAPSIGLPVAKSGRTTGTTTGTIASLNTSVYVQYQDRCGRGRSFVVSYVNQIVINGSGFSAGGDSGSLIVTSSSCHQPVGLLFAGSSSSTLANPIGEVLSKVGSSLGQSVRFVGGTCTSTVSEPSSTVAQQSSGQGLEPPQQAMDQAKGLPQQAIDHARKIPQQAIDHAGRMLEQNRHDLMSKPGVVGVGLGKLEDNSQAAVVVYVDKTKAKPVLPERVDDVPVRVILTDPFVAY